LVIWPAGLFSESPAVSEWWKNREKRAFFMSIVFCKVRLSEYLLLTQQHVEQRLKRIHDRQEAARKLAHNVELLLQQKSLIGDGGGISYNTPKMTSSELMTTARHVAKDFRTLTCQMTKDFAVDDKNNNLSKECKSHVTPTYQKEKPTRSAKSSSNDNNRSVAFTVGFDEDKQPVSQIPKALQVSCRKDRSKLTAQELDEKLRKAAERRNVSQLAITWKYIM